MLQRKSGRAAAPSQSPLEAPPIIHDVLRSPGQPLDAASRAFMEPRFGYDFSRVRVHAVPPGGEIRPRPSTPKRIQVGSNIVFGANQGGAGKGHVAPTAARPRTGARRTANPKAAARRFASCCAGQRQCRARAADRAADNVLSGRQATANSPKAEGQHSSTWAPTPVAPRSRQPVVQQAVFDANP